MIKFPKATGKLAPLKGGSQTGTGIHRMANGELTWEEGREPQDVEGRSQDLVGILAARRQSVPTRAG